MKHRRLSEIIATAGLLAFFLSGPTTASAAGPGIAFEGGPSLAYWRYGEGPKNEVSAAFSLAVMGRFVGVGADLFTGGLAVPLFNIFLGTDMSGSASIFISAGLPLPVEAVVLGGGLRVRITPTISLVGRGLVWVAYEGGYTFMLGAHYRF